MKKLIVILIALFIFSISAVPFVLGASALDVKAVGVLDQNPQKALQDFGTTFLWQITFSSDLYDKSGLDSTGSKLFVQSEVGDYIMINGKTVTQWNTVQFNSIMIHVRTHSTLGQYLEVNTNSILDGLIAPEKDNTVIFLKGLKAADGATLSSNVIYELKAGSTAPFVKTGTDDKDYTSKASSSSKSSAASSSKSSIASSLTSSKASSSDELIVEDESKSGSSSTTVSNLTTENGKTSDKGNTGYIVVIVVLSLIIVGETSFILINYFRKKKDNV